MLYSLSGMIYCFGGAREKGIKENFIGLHIYLIKNSIETIAINIKIKAVSSTIKVCINWIKLQKEQSLSTPNKLFNSW